MFRTAMMTPAKPTFQPTISVAPTDQKISRMTFLWEYFKADSSTPFADCFLSSQCIHFLAGRLKNSHTKCSAHHLNCGKPPMKFSPLPQTQVNAWAIFVPASAVLALPLERLVLCRPSLSRDPRHFCYPSTSSHLMISTECLVVILHYAPAERSAPKRTQWTVPILRISGTYFATQSTYAFYIQVPFA